MRFLIMSLVFITTSALAQIISWDKGLTHLQWAIVDGNDAKAIELIRTQPEQVHAISKSHHSSPLTHGTEWSTLQIAVIHQREKVITELLKHKPDLDYQDTRHHYTALHVAVQRSQGGVEQLLKAGADVSLQSAGLAELVGTDPLIMAINFDNLSAVRLLLKYGADPVRLQGKYSGNALNAISYLGRCPQYGNRDAVCGRLRMDMLKAVINYPGLDLNHIDGLHKTSPLAQITITMPRSYDGPITQDRLAWSKVIAEGIRLLVKKGADPCIEGPFGNTMKILNRTKANNVVAADLFKELAPRFQCYL